jgi:hypothetical protein
MKGSPPGQGFPAAQVLKSFADCLLVQGYKLMEFSQGDKKHPLIPVTCFLDDSEDQGPFGSTQAGLEQMLQDLIRDLQIARFYFRL